jgi:hypothetical protein
MNRNVRSNIHHRALAMFLCVSCLSSTEAYRRDVKTMCDGPTLTLKWLQSRRLGDTLDDIPAYDFGDKIRFMGSMVTESLRTSQGREFWHAFAMTATKDKASKLAAEASRMGIAQCDFVDWYVRAASLPPLPREAPSK